MKPFLTVIWLNYNSDKIMNIAKQSLSAIKNFDYPNYELILVDNGSTDKSLDQITKYLHYIKLEAKILKSSQNLGFTGGNNLAYRYTNPNAKYLALINSDLIPEPNSLSELVDAIECDKEIGAIQGVIFNNDMTSIHSSGVYLDEALRSYPNIDNSIRERYITYADGCYCIIRIDAVRRIQSEHLFDDELFAYYEDALLGIKLWNYGYKVKSTPVIVGKHFGGLSSGTMSKLYQSLKNRVALQQIIYTGFGRLYFYRTLFLGLFYSSLSSPNTLPMSSHVKALTQGFMIGSKLKKSGINLSLFKAPYVKLGVYKSFMTPRREVKVSINNVRFP